MSNIRMWTHGGLETRLSLPLEVLFEGGFCLGSAHPLSPNAIRVAFVTAAYPGDIGIIESGHAGGLKTRLSLPLEILFERVNSA